MKISVTKYAEALATLLKDERDAEKIDRKISNFFSLLVKRKETKMIRDFLPVFKKVWQKVNGQLEVKVTLPYSPSSEQRSALQRSLHEALGKEIVLNVEADEQVMGGMKLEFEEYLVDGTIRKNLEMLKLNLVGHGG